MNREVMVCAIIVLFGWGLILADHSTTMGLFGLAMSSGAAGWGGRALK